MCSAVALLGRLSARPMDEELVHRVTCDFYDPKATRRIMNRLKVPIIPAETLKSFKVKHDYYFQLRHRRCELFTLRHEAHFDMFSSHQER